MPDFKLPDLGEGMTEAEIDRWLVKEGDVVAEDDPLVELITDKATAEIPSPFAGTVTKIHAEPGAVIPVGSVLITISDGSTAVDESSTTSIRIHGSSAEAVQAEVAPEPPSASTGNRGRALPPVRKLAASLGVDVTEVPGTGPSGQVTRADVEAFASRGVTAGPVMSNGRRESLRGVRRKIAERMTEAHRIVPPVTHVEECDLTELAATRRLANDRAQDLPRLTFMPFIVKAVVQGLKDHPALNSSLEEETGDIVFHDRYDIGIAVETAAGLTVPVVRDADKKGMADLAAEIDALASAARGGTVAAQDLRGGTFTVSSPGKFGGLMATPIVFHPQAAILGVHRASEKPVVRDGRIVIRLMANFSVTFDHRILDGISAARFLLDVVSLLEHPALLALNSDTGTQKRAGRPDS